jgi:hypothetical protein
MRLANRPLSPSGSSRPQRSPIWATSQPSRKPPWRLALERVSAAPLRRPRHPSERRSPPAGGLRTTSSSGSKRQPTRRSFARACASASKTSRRARPWPPSRSWKPTPWRSPSERLNSRLLGFDSDQARTRPACQSGERPAHSVGPAEDQRGLLPDRSSVRPHRGDCGVERQSSAEAASMAIGSYPLSSTRKSA